MPSVSTSTLDLFYVSASQSGYLHLVLQIDRFSSPLAQACQELSLTLNVITTGENEINKRMQKYNWYVDIDK